MFPCVSLPSSPVTQVGTKIGLRLSVSTETSQGNEDGIPFTICGHSVLLGASWHRLQTAAGHFLRASYYAKPCRHQLVYSTPWSYEEEKSFSFFFQFIYLVALGLSCGMWDLVPWPGIKPGLPALGLRSLSHWITWEVLEGKYWIGQKVCLDFPIRCCGNAITFTIILYCYYYSIIFTIILYCYYYTIIITIFQVRKMWVRKLWDWQHSSQVTEPGFKPKSFRVGDATLLSSNSLGQSDSKVQVFGQ